MKHGYWWLWVLVLSPAVLAEEGDNSARINAQAGLPQAAFNNESYSLVYQVYMAHKDLAAAYKVAAKAVQSRPSDAVWLKRYAQAAEWVGQPAEALQAWMKLAQTTGNQEAWASVGRLAPSLLNDEAMLEYQKNMVRQHGINEVSLKAVTTTYERLDRIDDGISYLQQLESQDNGPTVLDAESQLAERTGRDEMALSLLATLTQKFGPREAWLMRVVGIRYAHGEIEKAWDVLKAAEPSMPKTAAGYWQTYAELSTQLEHRDEAQRAYQTLLSQGKASMSDMSNYVSLIEDENGLAAARLSEQLYRKYNDDSSLINAMYLYQRENDPKAALALVHSLSAQQRAHMEQNPDFLASRGELEWQQKDYGAARSDFEHALSLMPDNTAMLQNLVDTVMEQRDTAGLRNLLSRYEHKAQSEPNLWTTWASGWNAVSEPARALPFLQSYCRANPGDGLARLSLADTMDKMGDVDRARAVRLQVLASSQRQQASPDDDAGKALQDAVLAARLEMAPPDPGLALLRQRMQQQRTKGQMDPGTRELAISWLLAHGGDQWAQAWVERHGSSTAGLSSKELALIASTKAGASPNNASADASLTAVANQELASQKEEAEPTTMEQAFQAYEKNPNDEVQAQRFREFVYTHASWAGVDGDILQQGGLQRSQVSTAASTSLGDGWRLGGDAGHIQQSSRDMTLLAKPDSGDRETLYLSNDSASNTWQLQVQHTSLYANYVGASLGEEYHPRGGFDLHWRADYDADAPESAPMLAFGMKNQLTAGFAWPLPQRWYFGADLMGANYYSQNRDSLGNGFEGTLEMGRHFDWGEIPQTLKLVGLYAHFHDDSSPLPVELLRLVPVGQPQTTHYFMPESYRQASLLWSFGEATPTAYQQHWQVFGEAGPTYANISKAGYEARLGLHGPVFGHDRLALSAEQGKSGLNNGGIVRQATLSYHHLF